MVVTNWPEDWTPLDKTAVEKLDALAERHGIEAARLGMDLLANWWILLFAAWNFDEIEIGGYFDVPVSDPAAPMPVLHYPRSERRSLYFALIRPNRWRHQQTGRLIYDIHFRAKRPTEARAAGVLEPAEPPRSRRLPLPDVGGLLKQEACVRVFEIVWTEGGGPRLRTLKAAEAAANRLFEKPPPVLKEASERTKQRAWEIVQHQHLS